MEGGRKEGNARALCICASVLAPSSIADSGVVLKIWLIQGKEKRLLAMILEILEKARKRLSRQNSTIKVWKCEEKKTLILQKAHYSSGIKMC